MAFTLGTMASRLATAKMAEGKRTRQQIVGKVETAHQLELALSQSGSLGALRLDIHLMVIIP